MSDNLTFGIKMTFDGKQAVAGIGEGRVEMDKLGQSTLTAAASADKLNASQQFQSKWFAETSKSIREQSAAVTETSSSVTKLLDRYDPLGAKLKSLQADFRALDAAAGSGKIASGDDARVDAVYSKLQQEINAAKVAANGFGGAANDAFGAAASGAKVNSIAIRESLVMVREAANGNFTRMAGSASIFAQSLGLVSAAFNPVTLGILAVASAGIVMEVAYRQGVAEMESMNRALEVTSDFAGQTRGSMRNLASDISAASQMTIGQSKEVVTQLVASGRIGAEAFGAVAGLVSKYAYATGQSAEKATPQLIKLFEDPQRGAAELNQTMHFLTVEQMNHIRVLQEAGKETEAQLVLADALKDKLLWETENVGTLSAAWNSLRKSASGAWDSMMSIGRADTAAEKLAKLRGEVDRLSVTDPGGKDYLSVRAQLDKALSDQQKEAALATDKSIAAAKIDEANKANALILRFSIESQKEELRQKIALMQQHPEIANQADAIAKAQQQLAQLGAPKKEHTPHAAGVDADFTAALMAQNEAYKAGEMDLDAYTERVKALIATKTELGRKMAKEDAPFALNLAIEDANKDLDKQRAEVSKVGAETSQKLLDATQKNNAAMIQDDRARALAQFDIAKKAWMDKVEIERSGLALYAEGSTGREQAAKRLAETEVAYAQWTQSEIARINQQTPADSGFWGGAKKGAEDYQRSIENVSKNSAGFFTRSFKSMEDAVVSWARTGKLNIRDFANMAIDEFYRIQVAQPFVGALSGAMSGAASSFGSWLGSSGGSTPTPQTLDWNAMPSVAGGRASGGPVNAGSFYQVNENGPEMFSSGGKDYLMMGGKDGFVTPVTSAPSSSARSGAQTDSGAITLVYSPTIQIDATNATPGVAQTINGAVNQAMTQTRASLMAELASGGAFAVATGRRRKR